MASKEKMGVWTWYRYCSKREREIYKLGSSLGIAIGLSTGFSFALCMEHIWWSVFVLLPIPIVCLVIAFIMLDRVALYKAQEDSSKTHDKKDAGCEQGEESET